MYNNNGYSLKWLYKYFKNCITWLTSFIPSKAAITRGYLRILRWLAMLFCAKQTADGIQLMEVFAGSYSSYDSEKIVYDLLNKYAPEISTEIANFLAKEALANIIYTKLIAKMVPYGCKYASYRVIKNAVQSTLQHYGIQDKLLALFNEATIHKLINHGLQLTFGCIMPIAPYLHEQFLLENTVFKPSVLDDDRPDTLINSAQPRSKTLQEIKDQYLLACVIKQSAEIINALLTENLSNIFTYNAYDPKLKIGLISAVSAISVAMENLIKTQNLSTVNVDLQIANAEKIISQYFSGEKLSFYSIVYTNYIKQIQQSDHELLIKVNKNWFVDHDYPTLVAMREDFVHAYEYMMQLHIELNKISDYVYGRSSEEVNPATTKIYAAKLSQLQNGFKQNLETLANKLQLQTNKIENCVRFNSYLRSWNHTIHDLYNYFEADFDTIAKSPEIIAAKQEPQQRSNSLFAWLWLSGVSVEVAETSPCNFSNNRTSIISN